MAQIAYSAPSNSQVNRIWRKVQGPLSKGLNFLCEEWDLLDEMSEEDLPFSLRANEATFPVDLNENRRAASIPEGGFEAIPYTPNAVDATLTPIQYNVRFAASKLAMYADDKSGVDAQIEKELKFRGRKATESLAGSVGDDFYGFTTAILALTDTDITVASAGTFTITLKAGYGVAGITNTTYISQMFKQNDKIAILDSGTRRITATVSSVTTAGVLVAVTDSGDTLTTTTDNLQIVRAVAVENTQTNYNRGLTGWLDAMTSTSVQGISSSTDPNWSVAAAETSTGRFTGTLMHFLKDEVANYGGAKVNLALMDQGVYRDLVAQERSALRQTDPFALQIDGAAKSKGVQIFTSRRVPPGYVFVGDKSGVQKWQMTPKPGTQFAWRDGKEKIDENYMLFSADFVCQLAWKSRKKFAYASNKQRATS